jgi:hypothetical protein
MDSNIKLSGANDPNTDAPVTIEALSNGKLHCEVVLTEDLFDQLPVWQAVRYADANTINEGDTVVVGVPGKGLSFERTAVEAGTWVNFEGGIVGEPEEPGIFEQLILKDDDLAMIPDIKGKGLSIQFVKKGDSGYWGDNGLYFENSVSRNIYVVTHKSDRIRRFIPAQLIDIAVVGRESNAGENEFLVANLNEPLANCVLLTDDCVLPLADGTSIQAFATTILAQTAVDDGVVVTAYPAQVFLDLYAPVSTHFLERIRNLKVAELPAEEPKLVAGSEG